VTLDHLAPFCEPKLQCWRSLVVRLESQRLDRVMWYQYNPQENTVIVMDR
jgi:hypothetical protein